MKLTKRFLCLILSLGMVCLAAPALTFPVASAEATGQTEETVTISFRLADKGGEGAVGTLIAERTCKPGYMGFMPTAEEYAAAGVDPDDILGWYMIDTESVFYDASAFSGTYIDKDMVFYPYLKSSSLNFNKSTNFPTYSGDAITGFRGGWQIGHYVGTKFAPFTYVDETNISQSKTHKGEWAYGGAYIRHNAGQGLALAKNTGYATTLSWTALVNGTVDLDFNSFYFHNMYIKEATGYAYLAVAHNDKIIWPTALAAENVTVDVSDSTTITQKYYKVECTPGGSGRIQVPINDAPLTVNVEGGDTIRFVVIRGNVQETIFNPAVSYTAYEEESYGTNAFAAPTTEQPGKPLDSSQKPVATGTNNGSPAITYPGSWEMIVYDDPTKISNTNNAALIEYYTAQGTLALTAFRSAYMDYGTLDANKQGANVAPVLVNDKASLKSWGEDYAFLFYIPKNATAAIGGFRYTADQAGYIQASFDQLRKNYSDKADALPANGVNGARVAIFVDGVMVWPTAGADATDLSKWCQPFEMFTGITSIPKPSKVDNTALEAEYINHRDAINEELKELSFYVSKGSKVDFLLTYASHTKAQSTSHTVTELLPSVTYANVLQTEFSASATLGTNLALNFFFPTNTGAFQPSGTDCYLQAKTLALTLSGGAENFVFTQTNENGLLTATVSKIAAKQMTETVGYTLTAQAQKPNGTTERLTLAEGTLSVAAYLKALYEMSDNTKTRDLALATLQYGAAAQIYFGYKTNDPATAGIKDSVSFELGEAVDGYAQAGIDNLVYAFSGATIRLEDTVQLALLLQTADGSVPTGWQNLYLAMGGKMAKANIKLRTVDGVTYLLAVVDIPFAELATDYVITLHAADGTQVSSTLTYSVDTYAARTATADQVAMLHAIRVVGRAALNYKG